MSTRVPIPWGVLGGLLAFDALFTAWAYPQLPDQVPTHWGIDGTPDAWGDPSVNAFGLMLLPWGFALMMVLIPRLDPKGENLAKQGTPYALTSSLVVGLGVLIHVVVLLASLDAMGSPVVPLLGGISLFFLLLGNVMPRIPPNYMMGVRTPWTLASEEVWRKTHRYTGFVWVGGSLVQMACLLLPDPVRTIAWTTLILLTSFAPLVYSYRAYRDEQKAT